MRIKFINSMGEITLQQWSCLTPEESPFLSYEFLSALEKHVCVGEQLGWIPHHLIIEENDNLLAFMPLYIKYNSYGELVFDWSWADAYQRHGIPYYPKLVSAIPYTPVTGSRLLVAVNADKAAIYSLVAEFLPDYLEQNQFSSFHCLFPTKGEMESFAGKGYLRRLGCQFHWRNAGYQSFEHYLEHFSSRKRKNVKKERKAVLEQGFHFQMLNGTEIEPDLWPLIYELYQITFFKKSGIPTFSLDFFKTMGSVLADKFLVNLVTFQGQYVACAIFYSDRYGLYGRHWGCFEEFSNLHFETCYYRGLEYAIEKNLQKFEPGAQGEHKISRGFLPAETWSVHWIKDPVFRGAIADFVVREEQHMHEYMKEMACTSPFKEA